MQPIAPEPWHAPQPPLGPAPAPPAQPRLEIRYLGTGGGLFFVALKNLFLTLVTLGIYLPWARTERRKYLWQNIEVGGQRLRYHGTGREVLIGYLKVAVVYLVLFILPLGVTALNAKVGLVLRIAGILAIFPLIPIAIYGSVRYRLSRTSLRGIRFGVAPSAKGYLLLYLQVMLFTFLTLGLYGPYGSNRLHQYLVSRYRFGSERFVYDGADMEFWKLSMRGLLLTIVTLGFYYSWFLASVARFHIVHTVFQGARGRLDMRGGDIFQLLIVAYFGTILTLGIGVPWVTTYVLQVVMSKITFEGVIDFARVEQGPIEGNAAADDLASALDIGLEV
jgi:uncharacterized membrane protein YjgN (DUF898 family)